MLNFIKEYFARLRTSDEATKHRSALTISIVLSVIILSITFFIIKDKFLSLNQEPVAKEEKVNNDIESPVSAFGKFFKEAGEQFSKTKSFFKNVSSVVEDKDGKINTEASTSIETTVN